MNGFMFMSAEPRMKRISGGTGNRELQTVMTNTSRDERDAVSDARGEGVCHSLGKAMQTAHRHWLANTAVLKIAASDITAYQD